MLSRRVSRSLTKRIRKATDEEPLLYQELGKLRTNLLQELTWMLARPGVRSLRNSPRFSWRSTGSTTRSSQAAPNAVSARLTHESESHSSGGWKSRPKAARRRPSRLPPVSGSRQDLSVTARCWP